MKKITALVLSLLLCFAMAGCGGSGSDQAKPTIEKSVDALAEYLELTDPTDSFFAMIGAEDGKKYEDGKIEIYKFDTASDAYKDMEKNKTIMNMPVAGIKDGMVLFIQDDYPGDTEGLTKKFNEVEFK
ncbi:hypothetical protein NE619_08835 [Anaerovorax odorimutans]|uniref:Lipoprotein n=1 Tax=Anaerovorax odorimutans TaxID=109327 RepID=A0ABT1RNR7_9FIRM|nr:hypothetical protein [Anaerovorax odorimutans]MCQ4636835.1 hypothetical protein [Anaerovorax odorimutans]